MKDCEQSIMFQLCQWIIFQSEFSEIFTRSKEDNVTQLCIHH
jgi:hypothetical protein